MGMYRMFDMAAIRCIKEMMPVISNSLIYDDQPEWPTVIIEAVSLEQAVKIAQIRGLYPDDFGFLPRKVA